MEGHEADSGLSKGEHWTHNMPDHIQDNKVGPTAAWNSPAPAAPLGAAAADDATSDDAKAEAAKKAEAAAVGAKAVKK